MAASDNVRKAAPNDLPQISTALAACSSTTHLGDRFSRTVDTTAPWARA